MCAGEVRGFEMCPCARVLLGGLRWLACVRVRLLILIASALESPAAVAVAAVIAGGAALLLTIQGALVLELGLVELKARLAQCEIALPA